MTRGSLGWLKEKDGQTKGKVRARFRVLLQSTPETKGYKASFPPKKSLKLHYFLQFGEIQENDGGRCGIREAKEFYHRPIQKKLKFLCNAPYFMYQRMKSIN